MHLRIQTRGKVPISEALRAALEEMIEMSDQLVRKFDAGLEAAGIPLRNEDVRPL